MTRRVAFLLSGLAGFAGANLQSVTAQTLSLGDPRPPAASEYVACHEVAAQLRREMNQIGLEMGSAESANSTSHVVGAARLQWRAIAAELLDQPDPLRDPEIVLLGWMLVEHGEELDDAIRAGSGVSPGRELTAEQRTEVMWQLKRFGASPAREQGARLQTRLLRSASPDRLTAVRAAIRPLVEALTDPAAAEEPVGEPLAARLAAAASIAEGDAHLAPLADAIDRYVELRAHSGWRVEADLAIQARLDAFEDVKLLDDTPWMEVIWKQVRPQAVTAVSKRLVGTAAESDSAPGFDLARTAQCVRDLNELLLLPPRVRPRLDPFRKVILRWVAESAERNQPRPWSLLDQALAAMRQRREHVPQVSQHELRTAFAAIDEQSDELERMMGELLERESAETARSDPEWATVIGQHRENAEICQILTDLPDAVDYLGQFDRRAASTIWPRALSDASSTSDPRARESLLVRAREIVDFHRRYSELPSESRWREAEGSPSPLEVASRERILARLDAMRKSRAGEIINGVANSAVQSQLDAMRDLFRFVEMEQTLNSAGGLSQRQCLPATFVTTELQRFKSKLQRLLDRAPEGGVPFVRAVEEARRDAANVVILAHIATAEDAGSTDPDPALEPLAAIARSAAWPNADPGARAARVAQWKVLQFELALRSDDHGAVPEDLRRYAPFLAARLAEAIWDQSR